MSVATKGQDIVLVAVKCICHLFKSFSILNALLNLVRSNSKVLLPPMRELFFSIFHFIRVQEFGHSLRLCGIDVYHVGATIMNNF